MLGGGDVRRLLLDLDVIDAEGQEIGYVTDTWPLDGGGEPELILVAVGIKFPRPRYLPLRNAEIVGDCLHVPHTLLEIEEAPLADDARWGDPGMIARSYWAAHSDD
jgi:hypothetical protein